MFRAYLVNRYQFVEWTVLYATAVFLFVDKEIDTGNDNLQNIVVSLRIQNKYRKFFLKNRAFSQRFVAAKDLVCVSLVRFCNLQAIYSKIYFQLSFSH